jgi:Na+/melibiose symporter-like transporter
MSQEEEGKAAGEAADEATTAPSAKTPSLYRNYISFAGAAIAAAGFVSIALMLLLEFIGGDEHGGNPYIGIFTYILFPSVMGFGLVLFFLGALWERHRRHKMRPDEIGRYPVLDLNDPRRRRSFITFMLLAFIFLFMSAFGSYRAFEHSSAARRVGQE